MNGKKLVYIVSDIDKALHFEWIAPDLKNSFDLSFILIGRPASALEMYLRDQAIEVFPISYSGKLAMPLVWLKVLRILLHRRPDIIHTHLWTATLIGLTAGWVAGVRRRIYTRHHATIHYKEHRSGIKWDKLNNALATQIIAISRNVRDILTRLDGADRKKIRLLHHGFLFSYFQNVSCERTNALFKKYDIDSGHWPVIGVISRFLELKGIEFVIMAFSKLCQHYPNAHLVLANAHGNYEPVINSFLSRIPDSSVTKIRFENDLAALYSLFDIFVHVPVDEDSEAFGQTYVEPLIAGVPCIFTLSGVAPEFIIHNQNALVVDFKNADQIYTSMLAILEDESLRQTLQHKGKASVADFTIERYLTSLKRVYLE